MGILLIELVKLECRIAGLAAAAGLQAEVDEAMARADHYLRLRAQESRKARLATEQLRDPLRAWPRRDT